MAICDFPCLPLHIFLEDINNQFKLIIVTSLCILGSREYDNPVLWETFEYTQNHVAFLIEYGLILITNNLLQYHNSRIGRVDDGNQEIEHNNQHETDLHNPYQPDQSQV